MPAKTTARDLASEIAFLTRSLKAPPSGSPYPGSPSGPEPSLGATRSSWWPASSGRWPPESPTAGGRIKAARFPARKSLEELDFDHARSLRREVIAHLGTLDFATARENVIFLGPPGTGKTHLAIGPAIRACQAGHRVVIATRFGGWPRQAEAHQGGRR